MCGGRPIHPHPFVTYWRFLLRHSGCRISQDEKKILNEEWGDLQIFQWKARQRMETRRHSTTDCHCWTAPSSSSTETPPAHRPLRMERAFLRSYCIVLRASEGTRV